MPNCTTCKFFFRKEYGYSNYTVTDVELDCLKGLNPGLSKNEEFVRGGVDPVLMFGATCPSYVKGYPLEIDVDMEQVPYPLPDGRSPASYYTDDQEVLDAYISRMNT